MTLVLSTTAANAILDLFDGFWPAGSIMEMRSGADPGLTLADTGTVGASVVLPASPWAPAVNRVKSRSGTWQDPLADATVNLAGGHFRIRKAGDGNGTDATAVRLGGTISATGGGGDLQIDNPSIVINQTVTVTGVTITM